MNIRRYREDDATALRACFIALQDHEHAMIPRAPTGEAIADDYLAWMFERVDGYDGAVFVAEVDGVVVGFAGILCNVPATDPDDSDASHAFLGELSVLPSHRGLGVGRALIDAAIGHARASGADNVRLAVVSENTGAQRLYERVGFRSMFQTMILRLLVV